jgi:isoquinoline 1-oxidoreductase subunit beta
MTAYHRNKAARGLSRREMLAGSAGLSFAFALGAPSLFGDGEALAQSPGRLNAYVSIATDGTITISSPALEMGQGVNTSLPLIIAEELDADWSKVKVQQAPVNAAYNHPILQQQMVVGSLTTRGYWIPCRTAAAQARRVLLEAAAERWKVPVEELTTEPSTVVHAASKRRMSYGEVASFAKVPEKMPEIKPDQLKPAKDFRLIGKDVPRPDVVDKSSGKPIYAMDIQVPGMVYATLARAPVRGSGPVSFNADELKKQPGIIDAVALDNGVGIIGNTVEAVFAARGKLKAQWRDAPGSKVDSTANLHEYLAHVRDGAKKGVVGRTSGDANAAIAGAAKVHSSESTSDYVYHAQMEPHVCVASVTPNGVEVWTGTQWQTRAVAEAAKAAGVGPEKVALHQMQMGGSFGRNIFVEYVIDAVNLSKAAGKPVKMIQSRSDDVVHGRFRPMYAQRIEVGLDAGGKVVGWRHRIAADTVVPYLYGQARMDAQKGVDHIVFAGADVPHYDVPAHVADHIYEERGVRTAAWRGIGAGATNFAIEVVIDELAQLAGQSPLEYRLALLKDPRAKRVVETVAKMADWDRKREGTALGIAFGKLGLPPIGFSLTGTVAEVSLDRANGRIRCHNLWCAADVGLPVQPRNVVAQVESSLIFALGSALKERITIKDGVVEQTNFHDYEILRLSEIPQINVEVIRSGDIPLPVGELGIPGVVPAVSNAVFALTGRRLRNTPFTANRVKAALA